MNRAGYVYILTNKSFRENWIKIGKTSRPVELRQKELDNTALPLPFDIYATLQSKKYSEIEKHFHYINKDKRIREKREFFDIAPEEALTLFRDIAKIADDVIISINCNGKLIPEIPGQQEIPRENNKKPAAKRKKFKFSMIGIAVGEIITFKPTGLQVRVISDSAIEYQGKSYSLSHFVTLFLPKEKQTSSKSYQGPKYFTYKGQPLTDLRNQSESTSNSTSTSIHHNNNSITKQGNQDHFVNQQIIKQHSRRKNFRGLP